MPKYAAIGAAVATLIAEITQMLIQFYFSRSDILHYIRKRTIFNALFASVIAVIITFFIRKNVSINYFYNLMITIVVFFGIYIFILILIKDEYIKEMLKNVGYIIKKRRL